MLAARLWLLPLTCALGCNSAIDIHARQGPKELHFDDHGCAVSYTGNQGKVAVDLTCPATLRAPRGEPILHLSAPIAGMPRRIPLSDPDFGTPGKPLGQFLVITYRDGDRLITCDTRDATGAIVYTQIPRPEAEEPGNRLVGSFTDDASLRSCTAQGGAPPPGPLLLSGSFDVAAPRPR